MNPTDVITGEELAVEPLGTRDGQTVDEAGRELAKGIDGVELVRLRSHVDHRGTLTEVFNADMPFWREGLVYAYAITIRPGRIKGWGMHKLQADRYYVWSGSVRVVLHDGRVDAPTFGRFQEIHFTDQAPGLLRIPPGVWHADQNWGADEVHIVNFPTRAYDKADPDKYRIDPHTGTIPYDWELRDG
jgi:dTDP-4-dehydrorhamnose 3,5-epimerase